MKQPNIALQRTPSAAPPSPLSFGPLGRLTAVAALLCLGMGGTKVDSAASTVSDDIREGVFRYELEKCPWGEVGDGTIYFLAVEDRKDPSPVLLLRLKDSRFPIRPASTSVRDHQGYVRDRVTGVRGSLYAISKLRYLSSAEVEAGVFYCTTFSLLRLRNRDGGWRVVSEKVVGGV